MADSYGPFDGAPWTQAQWYGVAKAWMPTGIVGFPGASITAGPFAVTSSGLSVTVAAAGNTAWIRGAGYQPDTNKSLNPPANTNATLSRRDRVVFRRDLSAKTVTIVLLQGTPAATPVAPALTFSETGIWEESIASFLVPPNSATTLSGFVDERSWTHPSGLGKLQVRLWTFGRTGNASDTFANGSYIVVNSGTISAAPAGDYTITARLVISNTSDFTGFQRTYANGASISPSDPRADTIGNSRMVFVQAGGIVHAGGDLTISQYYNASGGTPTVWSQGTEMVVSYLGPRTI